MFKHVISMLTIISAIGMIIIKNKLIHKSDVFVIK